MPPTNAQTAGPALDFRSFSYMFRGVKPGQSVGYGTNQITPEQHDANLKAYEYYSKKSIDQMMDVQQPAQPPQFMSLTNSEGRVIDVLVKPDGTTQVVEPKTENTQQGIMTMVNPTNAVPVVNPQTGQPIMGYAADPNMGGVVPTAGGGMFGATNAATPTATPAPTPSPTPSFVVEATPDEIRQRYPNAPANLVPGMTIRLKSGGVIVVK